MRGCVLLQHGIQPWLIRKATFAVFLEGTALKTHKSPVLLISLSLRTPVLGLLRLRVRNEFYGVPTLLWGM